jgi:prepilin-type N-terminal cleavage/methylation domain-containing protein
MYARGSQGGFTLIECLAATLILGIGIVGVASMFTYANVSEREAAHLAQARAVADQTLEAVRAQGYAALTGVSGTQEVAIPGLPGGLGILAWRPYPNEVSDQGLKLVALNVTWRGVGRRAGRYWVTTLVAREGGSQG